MILLRAATLRSRYNDSMAAEMAQYPELRGARVLVAEDYRWIRETLRAQLTQHGCLTVGTDSVEETRAALQSNSFEVVVLDLGLKDGRADELMPDLRHGPGPHPGVIVVTASRDPKTLKTWRQMGARVLLKLDFMPADFPGVVAPAVQQYRERVAAMALAQFAGHGPIAHSDHLPDEPLFRDLDGSLIGWNEVRERYLDLIGPDASVSTLGLDCLRLVLEGRPIRLVGADLDPPIKEEAVKKRMARLRRPVGATSNEDLARMLRVSCPRCPPGRVFGGYVDASE